MQKAQYRNKSGIGEFNRHAQKGAEGLRGQAELLVYFMLRALGIPGGDSEQEGGRVDVVLCHWKWGIWDAPSTRAD